MQKESLIKLAFSMDLEPAYEKLYRFAQNYVYRLELEKTSSVDKFFECIKYCMNNSQSSASRTGISGKDYVRLQRWSRYILNCEELKNLSLEELCYVFACCARFCKARA